ncbi:hypothetical protein [Priestia flexa]|uniref:hypothetical protein n=1 Tax=Priestia flexa TaxID=86664 RepID=UPI001B341097|nr:hypothetical protein [Priestia flexa]
MYYESLEEQFQKNPNLIEYPKSIIQKLDDYIRSEYNHGYIYLNPYKFAYEYDLDDIDGVKIFLALTDQEKLFTVIPFVDCPCCVGKSLKIPKPLDDDYLYCDECRRNHTFKSLENSIYFYFKLNQRVTIPEKRRNILDRSFDPHSTSDIMERLNGNLKGTSPSSLASEVKRTQRYSGEWGRPRIQDITQYNRDSKNNPISEEVNDLELLLMQDFSNDTRSAL